MSIKAIQWVWDCSRSQNGQRLVLLAIADCANGDGGNAFPSVAELMRKANLSERAVRYAIEGLVKLGELEVSTNGGRRGTNRYRVVMDLAESAGSHTPEAADSARSAADSARSAADSARSAADSAPVTVLEPSTQPSSSSDADAPNAQTILKLFLDYLAAQGITTLHGQTKARLGKEIKAAIDGKVPEKLVRHALHLLYLKGKIGNPSLLPHLIIEVQQAKPVSGPPASKPFAQQADEYKSRKAQAEKAHGLMVDKLLEGGTPLREALAQADEAKRAFLAQEPVASSSSVPYIEGVILAEEPKEVTGS